MGGLVNTSKNRNPAKQLTPDNSLKPTPIKTLRTWEKLAKNNSFRHCADSRKFKKLLKNGAPSEYRWQAWCAVLDVPILPLTEYKDLPDGDALTMSAIHRDVHRTFPEHPYFSECSGEFALQRVLGKFAGEYPVLGYCQSMNFIIGFLLIVSGGSESEVFSFTKVLFTKYDLFGFFQGDLEFLRETVLVFDQLFRKKLNSLWKHFQYEEVSTDLCVLKWFMTLFTVGFAHSFTLHFWDNFLVEGLSFLHCTALKVLDWQRKELLQLHSLEIHPYMSHEETEVPF